MAKARWVEGLGVTLLVLELLLLAVPVTVLDGFGLLVLSPTRTRIPTTRRC